RPLAARHATRFNLWIGLFSILQVYFGSYLFFEVLGLEYHFPVRLELNRTPVFLYLLTISYFSTYYVVMSIVWRAFSTGMPRARRPPLTLRSRDQWPWWWWCDEGVFALPPEAGSTLGGGRLALTCGGSTIRNSTRRLAPRCSGLLARESGCVPPKPFASRRSP